MKVEFRLPSTGSAGEQQQILDDLLAAGVDGIAVSPVDPENQTAALNKIAEQALLITVDSDASKSKRVCYIGTDNFAAGEQAGKLIKEALPNGGKIMVFVGKIDAQNAQDRFGGIKKELEGSKVEVIDVRTDDTDTVRAQKNVEDTLVKYPDVACLVGLWSYNGPAILNAVKSGGKVGQVKIVCFDEEAETLTGVAEGAIQGTIVQQPFEFGRQAVTKMAKYLGGDKSDLEGGKQIVPTLEYQERQCCGVPGQAEGTAWEVRTVEIEPASRCERSRDEFRATQMLSEATQLQAPRHLLEMRGISKRFPGVIALENVNLTVRPGEVVALVGENGAGKSTLMKILGGVYQPDAGEILLDGQRVVIGTVNEAMRLGIAFIHQELNVLDNLDVAANIFLGREPSMHLV